MNYKKVFLALFIVLCLIPFRPEEWAFDLPPEGIIAVLIVPAGWIGLILFAIFCKFLRFIFRKFFLWITGQSALEQEESSWTSPAILSPLADEKKLKIWSEEDIYSLPPRWVSLRIVLRIVLKIFAILSFLVVFFVCGRWWWSLPLRASVIVFLPLLYFPLKKWLIYHGRTPIVPNRLPPQWIDPLFAFIFAKKWDLGSQVISPLLYYWCQTGKIQLTCTESAKSSTFPTGLSEVVLKVKATPDAALWESCFFDWCFEKQKTFEFGSEFTWEPYNRFCILKEQFDELYNSQFEIDGFGAYKSYAGLIYNAELTEKGKLLYDQLKGFKYYLEHIKKDELESLILWNSNYIISILPWIALFGLEKQFVEKFDDLADTNFSNWEDWTGYLSAFKALSIVSYCVARNINKPQKVEEFEDEDDFQEGKE